MSTLSSPVLRALPQRPSMTRTAGLVARRSDHLLSRLVFSTSPPVRIPRRRHQLLVFTYGKLPVHFFSGRGADMRWKPTTNVPQGNSWCGQRGTDHAPWGNSRNVLRYRRTSVASLRVTTAVFLVETAVTRKHIEKKKNTEIKEIVYICISMQIGETVEKNISHFGPGDF